MVAPALTDVDVSAISVPTKVEEELSVAELPTTQNTLHACAPFSRTTTLFDHVSLTIEDQRLGGSEIGSRGVTERIGSRHERLAAKLVVACGKRGRRRLACCFSEGGDQIILRLRQ